MSLLLKLKCNLFPCLLENVTQRRQRQASVISNVDGNAQRTNQTTAAASSSQATAGDRNTGGRNAQTGGNTADAAGQQSTSNSRQSRYRIN